MNRVFLRRVLKLWALLGFLAIGMVTCQSFSIPEYKKKRTIMPSRIEIDVSDLLPGEFRMSYQYGFPIAVYKRRDEEIISFKRHQFMIYDQLSQRQSNEIENEFLEHLESFIEQDADWINKPWRSADPAYFVFFRLSPISGCGLRFITNEFEGGVNGSSYSTSISFDSCTNLRYDHAGRIFYNTIEAEQHLFVPPHRVTDKEKIIISFDKGKVQ